ncbi:MAG: transposase [Gemmatimonadota bacterium]|nr:MAG: transposase [Gemmatimonadota bacterium]
MARQLRIEYPGAFYHITSRGVARQNIFFHDEDYEKFLSLLRDAHERSAIVFHGYCLMQNHYHLEVETPHGQLSRPMQWINQSYATYVNQRYHRVGHLFQGRFKSILVEQDRHAHELTRYIHMNPVRAKTVKYPADDPWSSYRTYIGLSKCPPWLETGRTLERFGLTKEEQRREYRKFVEEEAAENPLRNMQFGAVLGSSSFVEQFQKKLKDRRDDPEISQLRKAKPRLDLEKIFTEVKRVYGVCNGEFLSKGRKLNEARDVAIYLARIYSGCRLIEIGEYFCGLRPSAVSLVHKRMTAKTARDRPFHEKVQRIATAF